MRSTLVIVIAVVALSIGTGVVAQQGGDAAPARVDRATFAGWIEELSNWGRWGKDDQKGTLNHITPERRKAAARLVRDGVSVSLAHETLAERTEWNPNPFEHTMVMAGAGSDAPWAVDSIGVTFHGYAHSHLDAVCHLFYQGKMYNGYSRDEVTAEGCAKLAITNAGDGIFTRGVLMDLPAHFGERWLEPGRPIYPADLEAWEEKAGVRVGPGDVVLVRTGRWARWAAEGPWALAERSAGLHASSVAWLRERDVAVLGSDVASDVFPSGVEGETHPVHLLVLYALGMPIFDNLDLEAVAAAAAERKRWEFLLTAAPMRIPGGTGSPLNPIATF
jgi:kynurenine formamidase